MTRPKERDERSHGEGYPGSPDPDAETEEDRYGQKPDRDRGRSSRDENAPPPSDRRPAP